MIALPSRYTETGDYFEGGFGKVKVLWDSHLDRKVILKEIKEMEEINRLLNEIRALQKAKSKYVVQIYDVIIGNEGPEVGIIEEYLPGDDLVEFDFASAPKEEFIKVLYQLASGIKDLHDCGIVHRDLKPNNVKYDSEDILKIFDFGLAKHNELPSTTTGWVGTPGFMAPELFLEKPKINKPVDIFAFGVFSYFLAHGKVPESLKSTPPGQPDTPFFKGLGLPDFISDLLDGCVSADDSERPDIDEIVEMLEKELLYDRHRAVFVVNGDKYELNKERRGVRINRQKIDYASISYDGYSFKLNDIEGNVYVNNTKIAGHKTLKGSCVIILGGPELGASRSFVPFDLNHPEVYL